MKHLTNKQQKFDGIDYCQKQVRLADARVRLRQFGYGTEWVRVCLGMGLLDLVLFTIVRFQYIATLCAF